MDLTLNSLRHIVSLIVCLRASLRRFSVMLARRLSYHNLLEAVDREKLVAVQFLRGGLVRLTFKDTESCDEVIQCGLSFDKKPIRV